MVAWIQPPHETHQDLGLEVTFTSPAGVIIRVAEPRIIDLPMAEMITQLMPHLQKRFPLAKTFVYIHDWDLATGYVAEARSLLTSWGIDNRTRISSAFIVPPSNQGALLRLGISTASLALRAVGFRLEMKDSLADAVEAAGVDRAA